MTRKEGEKPQEQKSKSKCYVHDKCVYVCECVPAVSCVSQPKLYKSSVVVCHRKAPARLQL